MRTECVTVDDYDEMKSAVTTFIDKPDRKSVAASLYFYGKSDNYNKERSNNGENKVSDGEEKANDGEEMDKDGGEKADDVEEKGNDGKKNDSDVEQKGSSVSKSHIFKKAFLLIQTPTNKRSPKQPTSTAELDVHTQQASVNSELPKVTICERISAYSYDEMKSAVNAFMENHGNKTLVASVYFNGHGKRLATDHKKAQLCFNKPMQDNENLDTVLQDLEDIWEKSKCSNKNVYPWQFKMFFLQCYSHLHDKQESYEDRMQVCCYTSDMNPTTTNRERRDDITLKFSHHIELEKHASDEQARVEKTEDKFTPDVLDADEKLGSLQLSKE